MYVVTCLMYYLGQWRGDISDESRASGTTSKTMRRHRQVASVQGHPSNPGVHFESHRGYAQDIVLKKASLKVRQK